MAGWRMKLVAATTLGGLAGCNLVFDLLLPQTVRVELVNTGDFPIDYEIRISDQQDIPEFLLTDAGDEIEGTIEAGATQSIVRDCDDLQALILVDADLRVAIGVSPDADTGVLRDGDEFGCGDQITLTFTHSDVLLDFDVSVSITPQTLAAP